MKQFIEQPAAKIPHGQTRAITYAIDKKGCHICTSHRPTTKGYIALIRNRRNVWMHRFIWEKYNGPIPEGLLVLHACDNRQCINPHHLHTGTYKDNTREAMERGRHVVNRMNPEELSRRFRGEGNPSAKLKAGEVKTIRQARKSWGYMGRLAKRFGVSISTVSLVLKNRTWTEDAIAGS